MNGVGPFEPEYFLIGLARRNGFQLPQRRLQAWQCTSFYQLTLNRATHVTVDVSLGFHDIQKVQFAATCYRLSLDWLTGAVRASHFFFDQLLPHLQPSMHRSPPQKVRVATECHFFFAFEKCMHPIPPIPQLSNGEPLPPHVFHSLRQG